MAASKSRSRSSSSSRSSPSSRSRGGGGGSRSTSGGRSGRGKSSAKSSAKSSGTVRGAAHTTTDHDEIRQWIEERGGHPACVRGTGGKGDTGMIRVDYPGFSGQEKLQEISWDDFFEAFEENNLAFLYQDQTKGGNPSRFSKFVQRKATHPGHDRYGAMKSRSGGGGGGGRTRGGGGSSSRSRSRSSGGRNAR